MALPPLTGLNGAFITFGGRPLFQGVSFQVERGERYCLVGRNGSGKSTLLKVLAGEVALDSGERFTQPGAHIGFLSQDPTIDAPSLIDWVTEGLPEGEKDQTFRAEALLHELSLDPAADPSSFSGGEARRAALARMLVGEPEILLLDEPTNHLDLPCILWLEERLRQFRGALVVISHDRTFLSAVSNRTLWLDRGQVQTNGKGFSDFSRFEEEFYAREEAEEARMDKRLLAETHWLHRGVTARRKRNMGRLHALMDLRQERAARIKVQGSVKMEVDSGAMSGRLVIEADKISKRFGDKTVIDTFSTRIMRGDRVGLLGPNGAGKTTLLRMLTGDLLPDDGTVRLGTNLTPAYFDQKRDQLDPEATIWEVLTDGAGDSITVHGQQRHVVGYMREFLFEDRQAHSPVRSLSGGERNRLLLAKLLAKSSNLLIMDEPTNDLDMDTLDLLEETLAAYEGTLLVVSHDRDFLDRLVTSVIAVEGEGRAEEYVGGYSDYLRQRPAPEEKTETRSAPPPRASKDKAPTKLSYKEQRELDSLPEEIDHLGASIANAAKKLADPALYGKSPDEFAKISRDMEANQEKLAKAEDRWLTLETKREEFSKK